LLETLGNRPVATKGTSRRFPRVAIAVVLAAAAVWLVAKGPLRLLDRVSLDEYPPSTAFSLRDSDCPKRAPEFVYSGPRVSPPSGFPDYDVAALRDGKRQWLTRDSVSLDPSLSPDARSVVFTRGSGYDDGLGFASTRLFTQSTRGNAARKLTDGPHDAEADWSPTRDEVVFKSGSALEIVDVNTHKRRVLVAKRQGVVLSEPTWSPDGEQVAFFRNDLSGDGREIWTVRRDGTDARSIANEGGAWLTWSPTGEHLAYYLSEVVYVISIDGAGPMKFAAPAAGPLWSPDGSRIGYFTGPARPKFRFVTRSVHGGREVAAPKGPTVYELGIDWASCSA